MNPSIEVGRQRKPNRKIALAIRCKSLLKDVDSSWKHVLDYLHIIPDLPGPQLAYQALLQIRKIFPRGRQIRKKYLFYRDKLDCCLYAIHKLHKHSSSAKHTHQMTEVGTTWRCLGSAISKREILCVLSKGSICYNIPTPVSPSTSLKEQNKLSLRSSHKNLDNILIHRAPFLPLASKDRLITYNSASSTWMHISISWESC